jgi:two-component system sensor histidine kinase/response regulator
MVLNFGMEIEVADSGMLALDMLKRASARHRPVELVLMDWRMPDIDGLETARRIKADTELREIPAVLMVTAYGREEVLHRAELIGLQGVLIKPVTESTMFNTIIDILDRPFGGSGAGGARSGSEDERGRVELPRVAANTWLEPLRGKRVLVVDDNALNREVVTDFLLAVEVEVDTAINGQDALTRLAGADYHALLMDVHMPVMDGLSATREIRRQNRWASLPIIALTAQARLEDRQASLAAGMNAHLTKPIDEVELYKTLLKQFAVPTQTSSLEGSTPQTRSPETASRPSLASDAPNDSPDDPDGPLSPGERPSFIDIESALRRLGGNRERLFRLLQGFVRDFRTTPGRLTIDHRAGWMPEIAELAHAVKGAAAYLDARTLCEAAALLEAAARRGDRQEAERLAPVFGDHIEATLQHVDALIMEAVTPAAIGREVDVQAVLDLVAQTEPLVARGDYAAQPLLDDLCDRLAQSPAASLVEEARLRYEDLELEAAVRALRRLRVRLEHHLTGERSDE